MINVLLERTLENNVLFCLKKMLCLCLKKTQSKNICMKLCSSQKVSVHAGINIFLVRNSNLERTFYFSYKEGKENEQSDEEEKTLVTSL